MINKGSFKSCFIMSGVTCFAIGSIRQLHNMANASKTVISGPESLMAKKAHGTCPGPVQENLRYDCDRAVADNISCFNRHYAEYSGYAFSNQVTWLETITSNANNANNSDQAQATETEIYYDSVTGKPLFKAPMGRTLQEFIKESQKHGWPSFRDNEVIWENVRVLDGGETVSVDGTHLGHNLPDFKGNRYCINLVSVAGNPITRTDLDIN